MASLVVGPVSAATTSGTPLQVAQATSSTTGGINGTVVDDGGAPVSGASITVRGATTLRTTTDSKGTFQLGDIPPGLYVVTAEKPGYQSASEHDYAIFAGEVEKVSITLPTASFSSLHTIATVRTAGRGTFNTSPAAVNSVSTQDFINQASTGVAAVLNEIPGLQVSLPATSGNGAAPGAIVFANIRNSLAFETATLIDGHPLSVGKYGDYVLSFWTPFVFANNEVIKGPGADAPQTNYAIGGTLNMRTLDPTQQFKSNFIAGLTNTGGSFFNFGFSGTEGRLGYVADVAHVNEPSALNGQSVYTNELNGGVAHINGTTDVWGFNDSFGAVAGSNGTAANYNIFSLAVCCYQVSGQIDKMNELVKFRYKFSPATTATVSYLGGQVTANQNGNTSQLTPSTFEPGAGYTGSMPVGAGFLSGNVYPGGDIETNNEPMFQAEVSSTIGKDTILGRFYHAAIGRTLNEGNSNYLIPVTTYVTANGTNAFGATYNNAYIPVDWYNYFTQSEQDALSGIDLQYQHPYGAGNTITASYSRTTSTTSYWYQEEVTNYNPLAPGNQFLNATLDGPNVTIPQGSSENYNTIRLSDSHNWGEKFSTLLSLYDNQYAFTAAQTCGSGAFNAAPGSGQCLLNGSNATFTTQTPTHFDERLGLTYRSSSNLIFRGSMGSSIAPPYLNLLSRFASLPTCTPNAITKVCQTPTITIPANNPNLVPETSWGYDIGADLRVKKSYYASADLYLTNLYNQFLLTTVNAGLCTSNLYPASGCPAAGAAAPAVIPTIFQTLYGNVNNSRYEGIELSLKHTVSSGLGWQIQGSTQRGYVYNLGANFYCSSGAVACTPNNYNQNLGVIANQNFNGGSPFYIHSPSCTGSSTSSAASSYWCATGGGVSNQSVPYLQGYGEINWQNEHGWYASIGETLFGKNNSYNEPPFMVARATVRAPLGNDFSFQISGYNIFNAYKQVFPIYGGGVAVPLANGSVGPTNGNVIGPAQWSFVLQKKFGGTP